MAKQVTSFKIVDLLTRYIQFEESFVLLQSELLHFVIETQSELLHLVIKLASVLTTYLIE